MFLLKLFVHHRGGLRVYPVYVEGVGFICRGWLQSLQQHAGVVPQIRTFPLSANCLPIHYLLTSFLFPGRARDFYLLRHFHTAPVPHSPSYTVGAGNSPPPGEKLLGRKTQHLHLVLKLRISGAVPLVPQYAFMA